MNRPPLICRPRLLCVLALALMVASCSQSPDNSETPEFQYVGTAPNLASGADGSILLSYIEQGGDMDSLVYEVIAGPRSGSGGRIASASNFFVNWADFPSVVPITTDFWAAHWLVRQPAGGYAYDIFISLTGDAGKNWSKPFILHNDATPTEHGFVTLYPSGDALGAIWLDGRNMTQGHGSDHSGAGAGMTLRGAAIGIDGTISAQQEIDELTCDCCQTDVAIATEGPVAVYRNRSKDEIRDIYVSRFVEGRWLAGQPVHKDGWRIAGCPVNGPVVQASSNNVNVTWFSAADDKPIVKSAWSTDAGRSFDNPVTLSDDAVMGYVGAVLIDDDRAITSWLCRDTDHGDSLSICYRDVAVDGTLGETRRLPTAGTLARTSVPQLARIDDELLFVWTDRIDDKNHVSGRRVPIN